MTSQEKDRFICEKLGICWHEIVKDEIFADHFADHSVCSCGEFYWKDNMTEHLKNSNPDFTSEAGRVQLLKLIKTHKNYDDFGERYLIFASWDEKEKMTYAVPEHFMTNDTGKFRDAVYRWLVGEG